MRRSKLGYWLFLAPCLFSFLIVVIIPMASGMYYSLTDWNGIGRGGNFVGLENFVQVLTRDPDFFKAFTFTAGFALCSVLLINAIGFLLALLVNQNFLATAYLELYFLCPT